MSDAIKAAAQGLRYWELKQAAMANNLANVATTGFKAERVFARLMGGAGPTGAGATDYTAGALEVTDRSMDFAIDGPGFFVVRTPGGDRYTRSGSFSLDADGVLVDKAGNAVLADDGGSIVLPPGTVTVQATGEIEVDGSPVARFGIEGIPDNGQLEKEGGIYFLPPAERTSLTDGQFTVHQGQLEESNVNPMTGLVDMLEIQRTHAALQRTISVADGIDRRAANDIARID